MAFIQGQQGASNSSSSSSTTASTSVGASSSQQQQQGEHKPNSNMDDSIPSLTHATRVSPATVIIQIEQISPNFMSPYHTKILSVVYELRDAWIEEKFSSFFLLHFVFSSFVSIIETFCILQFIIRFYARIIIANFFICEISLINFFISFLHRWLGLLKIMRLPRVSFL